MRVLLLLFIVVPVVEMLVLIKVGSWIGAFPTVGLVLLTAVIGLNLLRQQGFSTLMRARSKLQTGELPAQEMLEGIVLAVGGALLLTPGFVTDAFGFCCLLPVTRRAMIAAVLRSGKFMAYTSTSQSYYQQTGERPLNGDVIDGEFHREGSNEEKK
ncbi:FxsA family protein [Zooshikella ganghwensis]|uniref:Membrane protein FxsA n=1 Tax=Zooshikella ganghwensis TaxID=202772 RepID=A0A4P9VT36_9GAMM|nr:FxsA family protein [Zooshikella ganghwensis]RDH45392.1 membrane protein FxsA [Zooshikella ganghwensis]